VECINSRGFTELLHDAFASRVEMNKRRNEGAEKEEMLHALGRMFSQPRTVFDIVEIKGRTALLFGLDVSNSAGS